MARIFPTMNKTETTYSNMCWDISYHDHNSDDEIPAGIFPTMTTTVTMRYLLGYFLP
jgi:hypothetical protein